MTEALIAAVNQQLSEAFSRSDAAGGAALYAEHAQLMPPNAPLLEGREAIGAFVQSLMDSGVASLQLATAELDIFGSMAVEVGRYESHDSNGDQVDVGKYVVIWRLVNGKWCLYRHIFNSDLPAH